MSKQRVHSFDLWGPILDTMKLGQQYIERYRQITANQNSSLDIIEKAISEYEAWMRGEDWALDDKSRICAAVEEIVENSNLPLDYNPDLLQQDGLYVMDEILNAGEGVIVVSSGKAPWLKSILPSEISDRMGEVYLGKKTDPETFFKIFKSEAGEGRQIMSHTADELPELETALETGLFFPQNLIYINRNNSKTSQQVLDEGIGKYVNNLIDVGYTHLL